MMNAEAPARAESALRLVVGLGNPGARYAETRHNVGFRVVEALAARRRLELGQLECNAIVASGSGVMLVLPQTYMNRSGFSLRCLFERHELHTEDVLVVYDDVALPLGRLRLRVRGGPGGHRGMESIIENLRTDDVARLRCGIAAEEGEEERDLVEFVLEPFAADEREAVESLVERAADACETWLAEGPATAMNRFNS